MEGFLPHPWWEIWFAISAPVIAYGVYRLSKISKKLPEAKPLLALMGAFIFIISALKLPSLMVPGSSSHPTGSGLAAIVFGPVIASVLSMIALLFQALLLAHGGLTTLGANVFSMGIMGPAIAFLVWIVCKRTRLPSLAGVFLAVALSDLTTYVVTSVQIALAFPAASFLDSFMKFSAIFALTQIPLAIGEGILATFVFDFLFKYRGRLLSSMKVTNFQFSKEMQHKQLKTVNFMILSMAVLALFLFPFLVFPNMQWGGTDTSAGNLITSQGYQPWLTPVWTPPSNVEGLLFAAQAASGVVVMAYVVARLRAKKPEKAEPKALNLGSNAESEVNQAHLSTQIDTYAYKNAIARVSPATKIFLSLSSLLLSVLSPSPIIPIIVFTLTAILLLNIAHIPARFYFSMLVYPTALIFASCLMIALFFGYGETLAMFSFPWFTWTIFANGVYTAVATFFRVEGALSSTLFLVLTTSIADVFITLRRIRIPKIIVEISLLIYRYIFVFAETTAKMNMAQELRLGHSSWTRRVRATALLAGNLFIRTLEQGEQTFTAMNARGYDGNVQVLEDLPKSRKVDVAMIAVFDTILIVIALLTVNFGMV